MFKVPDWEADVPKNNINLKKIGNSTKKTNINYTTSLKKVKNNKPPPLEQQPKVNRNKSLVKKRKHNGQIINKNKNSKSALDILTNIDTERADEALLNAKKKKFNESIEQDDKEDILFKEVTKKPKASKIKKKKRNKSNKEIVKNSMKKQIENEKPTNIFHVQEKSTNDMTSSSRAVNKKMQKLKAMLQMNSNRNSITVTGNKLRERMLDRLKAAQFRYLNEKLYTSSGVEAKELFQSDPAAFHTYHQGYQQQLKKWPVNPLDVITKRIQNMPKTHTIADMGCGEGALSKRIPHKIRSFDLVSTGPGVETCDMAHTPLLAESMDVAVYCLALMGTELTQYLVEANRVLRMGGHLLIAEVESRFDDVDAFTKEVMKLGFKLKNLDKKHKVFFFMEFIKIREPPAKKTKLPVLTLKPCLYKKR